MLLNFIFNSEKSTKFYFQFSELYFKNKLIFEIDRNFYTYLNTYLISYKKILLEYRLIDFKI